MADRLHLSGKHRRAIEALLREHLPGVEAWAYGSRVNGRSHDGSDLDLVLRGQELEKISDDQLGDFAAAIRDSTIPFLVEARDWARLPERICREIESEHAVLIDGYLPAREIRPTNRKSRAVAQDQPSTSRLDEMCELIVDCPHFTPDWTDHGYVVIRNQNIRNGRLDLSDPSYTHRKDFERRIKRAKPRPGDIIFTREAPMGEACVLPGNLECCVGQRQVLLRPSKEVNGNYLCYALRSPFVQQQILWNEGTGSTVSNVRIPVLKALNIPRSDARDEATSAACLRVLDDKIELNRRMNSTLEAMARAIFKDWFVDFGPTHTKAEGGNPYLPTELWNLFPDESDDQGKPVGWAQDKIGYHVVSERGLSYKGVGLTSDGRGIPLHNLNSILEGGGYKNEGLKFYLGDYKQRHLVRPGDLIVANTEQGFDHLLIGYSSLVPGWMGDEGLFSHHLFKVEPRPRSPLSPIWLHFALSASSFGEVVRRYSNGTTVNMLPRDALEKPEIIVPPVDLIQAFGKIVAPHMRRMEDAFTESQALARTRDLLLPKLISGEIRVSQAEEVVEEVL